jgi:hypothetical protein
MKGEEVRQGEPGILIHAALGGFRGYGKMKPHKQSFLKAGGPSVGDIARQEKKVLLYFGSPER